MACAHFQDVHIEAQALALNHRVQDGDSMGKGSNKRRKRQEEGGQEWDTAQGMPGMPPSGYASCLGLFPVGL